MARRRLGLGAADAILGVFHAFEGIAARVFFAVVAIVAVLFIAAWAYNALAQELPVSPNFRLEPIPPEFLCGAEFISVMEIEQGKIQTGFRPQWTIRRADVVHVFAIRGLPGTVPAYFSITVKGEKAPLRVPAYLYGQVLDCLTE